LSIANALPSGGTHFSPFPFWSFWRSDWLGTATREHGSQFLDLCINSSLLLFETFDGGSQDFGAELLWRHLYHSYFY
jgi:hypothetical protein